MVTMCHYPFVSWNHKPHGSIHLFGHVHDHLTEYINSIYDLKVDVGFNSELAKSLGTFLIPFEEIIKHFDTKTGGMNYKEWTLTKCKEL